MNPDPRLSLNQITTRHWPLTAAVRGCQTAGITGIGLWRDKVAELGVDEAARLLREAGVAATSLCRGGFFAASDPAGPGLNAAERMADNRRAIEEAAALGADVLVLVCGGQPDRDLQRARAMVHEGIEELIPYARDRAVRLAIEPLHPMFCADRSVISTLAQALDLVESLASDQVGVVIDAYHLWWDPELYTQIARAGQRIFAFQVCDWIVPLPEVLAGRGMLGDGVIELRRLREAVDQAGYSGPIEVEVFNHAVWDMPGEKALSLMVERYAEHVGPLGSSA